MSNLGGSTLLTPGAGRRPDGRRGTRVRPPPGGKRTSSQVGGPPARRRVEDPGGPAPRAPALRSCALPGSGRRRFLVGLLAGLGPPLVVAPEVLPGVRDSPGDDLLERAARLVLVELRVPPRRIGEVR